MKGNCDNNRPCPCTYDCPRHGKCCACVAHHRDHNEGVPGMFLHPRRRSDLRQKHRSAVARLQFAQMSFAETEVYTTKTRA